MLGAGALAIAMLLGALAEEDRVSFVIVRDVGAEMCPDNDTIAARVRERIGSEPFADEGPLAPRQLRAGIALLDDETLEARIALFSSDGTRLGRRVLRGPANCRALADDLVLAIAIAIDPLLLVRRRPTKPAAEVRAATPASAPAPTDLPRAVGQTPRRDSIDIPPPVSVTGRALVAVAAGVGVVATPSARVQVSLDYGALDVDGGFRFDLPSRYPVSGDALLDLTLIAFDAGPCVGWDIDITTLRACGTLQAGMLVAQGIGFLVPRSSTTPWLAVGTRAAFDMHLWPGLGLVVEGELQAPLVRARFVDDVARQTLSQSAIVVGSFGVGLELQLR